MTNKPKDTSKEEQHKCKEPLCDGKPKTELNGKTYCEQLTHERDTFSAYTNKEEEVWWAKLQDILYEEYGDIGENQRIKDFFTTHTEQKVREAVEAERERKRIEI